MHDTTRPLPDTHPEFTVTHWPGGFTEYRVEHWHLARDGSGRVVPRAVVCAWPDVLLLVLVALLLFATTPTRPVLVGCALALASLLLWARCTQVLHESLLVFPTLGIQLETHRGHPLLSAPLLPPASPSPMPSPTAAGLTTSITRHFIPLWALEDVVLHEGLRGWTVRYYLAALHRRHRRTPRRPRSTDATESAGTIEVHVPFENVLPYFPVLRVVYLGVQETFFRAPPTPPAPPPPPPPSAPHTHVDASC